MKVFIKLAGPTSLDLIMYTHSFLTISIIMIATVFISVLFFSTEQRKGTVKALMILALITTIFVFILVNITGLLGYIDYRMAVPDSPKTIILGLSPFVHEVYFETMEYVSLLGPIWATLITWLVWHYKEKIFTNVAIKSTISVLVILALSYALVIAYTGIVPTRIEAVH